MATLDEVPEADRADFSERLALFRIDPSSFLADDLTTIPSTITSLSMASGVSSRFQPVILSTSDFGQLNEWVGVPDRVFDETPPVVQVPRLPPQLRERVLRAAAGGEAPAGPGGEPARPVEDLNSEELALVRNAARALLRGDSREAAPFRDLISVVFPIVQIPVWPILRVVVKSGSVLEFGPGQNVLLAYSVTIEDGGIIRSYGNLNVSATILERSTRQVVIPIDKSLFGERRFGSLVFEG
jgi:hypothetical protein